MEMEKIAKTISFLIDICSLWKLLFGYTFHICLSWCWLYFLQFPYFVPDSCWFQFSFQRVPFFPSNHVCTYMCIYEHLNIQVLCLHSKWNITFILANMAYFEQHSDFQFYIHFPRCQDLAHWINLYCVQMQHFSLHLSLGGHRNWLPNLALVSSATVITHVQLTVLWSLLFWGIYT